jgi:hypothetical protein
MRVIAADDLSDLVASDLVADNDPLVLIDLDAGVPPTPPEPRPHALLVGFSRRRLDGTAAAFASELDLTLASAGDDGCIVVVPDVDAAIDGLASAVAVAPLAAATLAGVLRLTSTTTVLEGLTIESLAYSALLAGPEFGRWRAGHPRGRAPEAVGAAVSLERAGPRLDVMLNRPDRRNAFSRELRDGLVEAFDLVRLDDTITAVQLSGAGPAFCSGGDLDEFGTTPDPVTAHLIRTERSVARRIDAVRDRVTVNVHGACIGAGIELPSFAGRVVALSSAWFRLPELAMGLIPGAGGTVGITRRIGRWRCAYLALTGVALDANAAWGWGLVDELDADH